MQDYIDIIDQEGLLTNKQEETSDSKLGAGDSKPSSASMTQSALGSQALTQKKTALAKLPEESKDGWKKLEQNMNKESQEKREKEPKNSLTAILKK